MEAGQRRPFAEWSWSGRLAVGAADRPGVAGRAGPGERPIHRLEQDRPHIVDAGRNVGRMFVEVGQVNVVGHVLPPPFAAASWMFIASARACAALSGRTMTVSSSIAPSLVEVQEVASLDLDLAHAGAKDECVVRRIGSADLAHIAEVREHPGDGVQDHSGGGPAVVGLERNGAAEDDVLAQHGDGGVNVACFESGAKRVHDLTSLIVN